MIRLTTQVEMPVNHLPGMPPRPHVALILQAALYPLSHVHGQRTPPGTTALSVSSQLAVQPLAPAQGIQIQLPQPNVAM